jgi:ABC-type Fe3+ transport system permease subunit
MDPFTAMLFLDGALGVLTIAILAYIASGRRPETRFTLVISLLLLAALFAFLPLSAVRASRVSTSCQQETEGSREGTSCVYPEETELWTSWP